MKPLKHGFTLVEILVALVIFATAILGIVQSRTSALRNARESERVFEATQLAQLKMTEMELKFQKSLDQGFNAAMGEETGAFEEPFQDFRWKAVLKEAKLEMTEADLSQMMSKLGFDEDEAQDQIENPANKLVMGNLNKILKENLAELAVSVSWTQFGQEKKVQMVTHLIPTQPKISLSLQP
jgi:prepilin-type N-terminal cleavage/methylation domain-containing protein